MNYPIHSAQTITFTALQRGAYGTTCSTHPCGSDVLLLDPLTSLVRFNKDGTRSTAQDFIAQMHDPISDMMTDNGGYGTRRFYGKSNGKIKK